MAEYWAARLRDGEAGDLGCQTRFAVEPCGVLGKDGSKNAKRPIVHGAPPGKRPTASNPLIHRQCMALTWRSRRTAAIMQIAMMCRTGSRLKRKAQSAALGAGRHKRLNMTPQLSSLVRPHIRHSERFINHCLENRQR